MDRTSRICAGFFVLALALAIWSTNADAEQSQSRLFGGSFHSLSIKAHGEPVELVKDTRLRVRFFHNRGHEAVSWRAGCNYFGAKATVTSSQVITRTLESTLIGCPPKLERQDDRFASFFGAHPSWSFARHRLRLAADDTVIHLHRRQHNRDGSNR